MVAADADLSKRFKSLTDEQVAHFMEKGYVRIPQAFSKEMADEWTKTLWVRLGYDPNDKTTWTREKIHMPWHRREPVTEIAPKAWDAMCDLLGGAERIDSAAGSSTWGDSFIVNLGAPQYENDNVIDPRDLGNWHVDGDFFVHFLDSPEQGLLVIPIFSPIRPRGGGTYICPAGMPIMAKWLYEHTEGSVPTGMSFTPSTSPYLRWSSTNPTMNPTPPPDAPNPDKWIYLDALRQIPPSEFVELTGDVGDVILMHPLMPHSASKNHTRIPRVITNPPVSLREPFCFDRSEKGGEYSLVERKTMMLIGGEKLKGWKVTEGRRRIVPMRLLGGEYEKNKEAERARLQKWKESKKF